MSLVTKTIDSRILGKKMNLAVYRPAVNDTRALPVLYFFHGRTGNESLLQWLGMEKTADAMIEVGEIQPLIVVCPNLDNSRGINSSELYREVKGKYGVVHKGRYEDYLLDELIPFVDHTFHTIRDRSARYIGGISSGGYTALSIGLRHQGLFSKIGGHMPAIDLSYADEDECYFADETMWLKNDPVSIAKQTVFDDLQVFLDDGKEDEGQFYRACEKLFQLLRQNGADVQNHVFEGHHSGDYIRFNMETYLRFYSPCRFQFFEPC
jgi:enterochelin esterase-like enzyme